MRMPRRNNTREERITNEILVDCYGTEEQAIGWYCYLEEKIEFQVLSKCIAERQISPLRKKDEVHIIRMALTDECTHEMFVIIQWMDRHLAVPLSQLTPVKCSAASREAIEDWLV